MSNQDSQSPEAQRLIAAYLDETLTDDECETLHALLREDPGLMLDLAFVTQLEEHARVLLAEQAAPDSNDHGNLLVALNALAAGEGDAELVDLTDEVKARRVPQRRPARTAAPAPIYHPGRVLIIPRALAYAAIVAVGAGVFIALLALIPSKSDPAAEVGPSVADVVEDPLSTGTAQITRTRDAQWGGTAPDADGWMMPGLYRLETGFIEMDFADGASVLIQGPSSFELISGSRMELLTGMASARVPDGAEGFTIESPAGQFVDLGTAFGVDISGAGVAELHVFDGEVEAHPRSTTLSTPMIVHGGEAVAVDAARPSPEKLHYRPEKFVKTWEATRSGVTVTESIRYLFDPPRSVRMHKLEHNEQIVMFREQRGVLLKRPLAVSFDQPGRYVRFSAAPGSLAPGTRVDSYFVHFDRVGIPTDDALIPVGGVITFDRPVAGIIVNDELLDDSQSLFRLDGTRYPSKEHVRGLEFRTGKHNNRQDLNNYQDVVVLSGDLRTVRLHLETSSKIDQLRILVEAEDPPGAAEPIDLSASY